MAELSDKYTKILSDISTHISDKDEKKYVEKKIIELSSIYIEILDRITKINNVKISKIEENQGKILEKVAEIQENVNNIKGELYDYDGYDLEIVCPYCNAEFTLDLDGEQKKEIRCPECNNIIELEWDDNEKESSNDEKSTKNSYKNLRKKDDDDEF